MINKKVYLGDAVYAEYDGHHIILTTDDGFVDDVENRLSYNKIYLDDSVLHSLELFKQKIIEWLEAKR